MTGGGPCWPRVCFSAAWLQHSGVDRKPSLCRCAPANCKHSLADSSFQCLGRKNRPLKGLENPCIWAEEQWPANKHHKICKSQLAWKTNDTNEDPSNLPDAFLHTRLASTHIIKTCIYQLSISIDRRTGFCKTLSVHYPSGCP